MTSLILLLIGCFGDQGGTAVGNPGNASLTAATGKVEHIAGTAPIDTVTATGCDGTSAALSIGGEVSLKGGVLPIPSGLLCDLDIALSGPLTLSGQFDSGGSYDLTLDMGRVRLDGGDGFEVTAEGGLVIELAEPGWLDPFDPGAGTTLVVEPGSPQHDAIAATIAEASAVYNDTDDDGRIDNNERAEGSIAEGGNRSEDADDFEDDDDDTGDDDTGDDDTGDDDTGDDDTGDDDTGDDDTADDDTADDDTANDDTANDDTADDDTADDDTANDDTANDDSGDTDLDDTDDTDAP